MSPFQKGNGHGYYDICEKFASLGGQWPYLKPRERLFCMSISFASILSILFVQVMLSLAINTSLKSLNITESPVALHVNLQYFIFSPVLPFFTCQRENIYAY